MRLHNHTLKYLSLALLPIISAWAVIFYINMLDEVYDSIDDGLDNYKMLIIEKAHEDSAVLHKDAFNESNYAIREISREQAIAMRDRYRDTSMYMINEEDFEPVRILTTAFTMNNRFYELQVISSMVEEDDLIEDLFFALLWLYLILLAAIFLMNNFLLAKIWQPFYQILGQLKTFRLGKDPIVQPTESKVAEFRELNEALITLLQRNLETYNNQKQFTENAAHELQTPLAIGINKLELLLEKNGLSEEQSETVGQVIQMLERLTQLNKSLLLLSRIENKQFTDDQEISVNEICRSLVNGFKDLTEFKGIEITYTESGTLNRRMNPDLTTVFISNLLKNAIVHNIPGGYVKVHAGPSSLSICNSGKDAPLDPARIFNRFYKETTTPGSTGLGLSIVKAIADLYGLTVSYNYNKEHCIEVKFFS